METQPQCLEHLDAEQGLQKILLLTPSSLNIAYEQKGLSSFSNIHFFNKLLYFYQADELWIPFQLIGKYRYGAWF